MWQRRNEGTDQAKLKQDILNWLVLIGAVTVPFAQAVIQSHLNV